MLVAGAGLLLEHRPGLVDLAGGEAVLGQLLQPGLSRRAGDDRDAVEIDRLELRGAAPPQHDDGPQRGESVAAGAPPQPEVAGVVARLHDGVADPLVGRVELPGGRGPLRLDEHRSPAEAAP